MIPTRYQDFYGDETRWFIGRIVSIQDPMQLGRVKVRIMGIHTENTNDIPDSALPWAQTILPITEGGTNGLGIHTGIQVNARVFGIFLDGTNSQLPLVLGSLPKLEDDSPGGRSTNQLARGTNTITKTPDSVTGEPDSPYAAEYPNNAVHATPSGHVIEIDDTSSAERIHVYHKSGTFIEMHPNGDVVTHHKNGFRTVTGNDKLHVTGSLNIVADGDITIDGKTINLNSGTKGAARIGDTADTGDDPPGISGGDGSNKIESGSKTVFIGG